jgi:peptidoglycan-associated lipoprotein
MRKLLCIAGLTVVLAACSSTPADQSAAPVDDRNPLASTTGTAPGTTTTPAAGTGLTGSAIAPASGTTATATQAGAAGRTPLNDPASILSKRSVFYDYDSFVVKDEFKPLIEAHGKYLRENKNARVIIQGNTDERGGREYNLALGHKRAESVKKMLSILGVQEVQMETVSFGKEKPRNPGTDEAAYAENRRSDLVYQGE